MGERRPHDHEVVAVGARSALVGLLLAAASLAALAGGCVECHADRVTGFGPGHDFAPSGCTVCHAGDAEAQDFEAAHAGLVAFPANLSSAGRACGGCHAALVAGVRAGRMRTGAGVVGTTRFVLGEQSAPGGHAGFAGLGHSPADSLLRKLCASCHLGHDRTRHALDSPLRGGGCAACHVSAYPPGRHVRLDRRVGDDRCFGCHARLGRISLSYAGLAEVDEASLAALDPARLARLPDGRLVMRNERDAHHRAGLACIDCHTAAALMGTGGVGVDIACTDCHQPASLDRGASQAAGEPVTGRLGTALRHVERSPDGLYLRRKLDGSRLRIPPYRPGSHLLASEHARLTCSACHARWAPQCYGCHVEFDPAGRQWDHQAGAQTPGRWRERRWAVRSGPPPLGVDEHGRIGPFVPGMVMTLDHPALDQPRFVRRFAPLEPHTTGAARRCEACHRDPVALGLGHGRLEPGGGRPVMTPLAPRREDGLAEDAWTALGRATPGGSTRPGARSFTDGEIRRILAVPLAQRSAR